MVAAAGSAGEVRALVKSRAKAEVGGWAVGDWAVAAWEVVALAAVAMAWEAAAKEAEAMEAAEREAAADSAVAVKGRPQRQPSRHRRENCAHPPRSN